jgi:hypothetical protein
VIKPCHGGVGQKINISRGRKGFFMAKAHKNGTADYGDLDFAQGAKSINAYILALEKMIKAHEQHALFLGKGSRKNKFIASIQRMISRL